MRSTYTFATAALALGIGLAFGPINAGAQTSTGGMNATDDANSDMQSSGSTSSDAGSNGSTVTVDKATFVTNAESSNMFEIESSKLALKQARSKQVRTFAQSMIKDHTMAGKKMQQVLKTDGMKPTMALTAKHEALLQQLESAKGADFDRAYVTAQTQGHMEAVALFRNYAAEPDDEALGAFAKATLPTLEKHLASVQKLGATQ